MAIDPVGRSGQLKIESRQVRWYGGHVHLVSDGLFSAADRPTDMYDLSADSADPPRDSEVARRPE